ncbi:unnamed protein product, partial [Hymenolepis diminuta]
CDSSYSDHTISCDTTERTRKYRLSIDPGHPLSIRRLPETVTPKMPILWRMSLSSRLAYQIRRSQNYNEDGQKEGFYGESSTSSSTRQNPNNKRALTQTRKF